MVLDETEEFRECAQDPVVQGCVVNISGMFSTQGFTMIRTTQSMLREMIVTEEAQVQTTHTYSNLTGYSQRIRSVLMYV